MSGPAIVLVGGGGAATAERLRGSLAQSDLWAPRCAACPAERRFDKLARLLPELFTAGRPIIGICAAGILIRTLAPLLGDKRAEPPVLAVAEDGSVVVPLLGGHRGANALAREVAAALGCMAAITTATELRGRAPLDMPPAGWRLAPGRPAAALLNAVTASGRARIRVESGDQAWLAAGGYAHDDASDLEIRLTHRAGHHGPAELVLHPPTLALGVGTERGVDPAELERLVRATLDSESLAPGAIAGVFSIDLKAAEPAIHALAASLGVPARFLDRGALARETPRLATPSALVEQEVGVAGVAEAAALAAAGPTGRLIVPKRKGERVTCAIALAPLGIDPQAIGRPQGRLLVVGIGPGAAAERTLRAIGAIEAADELVGYGLYLDLVADLACDRPRHRFPLGAEESRCRFALERAAQGRTVALVSSGDPGIYAMASLVFELIAQADDPAIVRIAVEIVPGVSAMQAAAAAAGAPLGHDFCVISLSDLLTPRAAILERLRAAAVSDLVVALYNPVSARRRELLDEARSILLEHRPATTPVILARALGRAEQQLRILALADLQVEMVDMLTVVLIGSTATRLVPRLHGPPFVVTPRGYALS